MNRFFNYMNGSNQAKPLPVGPFLGPIDTKLAQDAASERIDEYKNQRFDCDDFKYKVEIKKKFDVSVLKELKEAKGCFGIVYEGRKSAESKERYAIKAISSPFNGPKYLEHWEIQTKKELFAHSNLSHPNILKLHDWLWLSNEKIPPEKCHLLLKTEFLDIELFKHLSNMAYTETPCLTPDLLKRLLRQVGSALNYMHSQKIVHHDIKPENIMLSIPPGCPPADLIEQLARCIFKLIDFGFAKRYEPSDNGQEQEYRAGSVPYVCPEKHKDATTVYDPYKADSFALGVVLLQAMMGIFKLYDKNADPKDYFTICQEFLLSLAQTESIHLVTLQLLAPEANRFQVDQALNVIG